MRIQAMCLLAALLAACSNAPKPITAMAYDDVTAKFNQDRDGAQDFFDKNAIKLVGKIDSVSSDGTIFIKPYFSSSLFRAVLTDAEKSQASSLHNGQDITVVCQTVSKGETSYFFEDCAVPTGPVVALTADQLLQKYQENPDAIKPLVDNNIVQITGHISDMPNYSIGFTGITFASGLAGAKYRDLTAYFPDFQKVDMGSYKKGDSITVICYSFDVDGTADAIQGNSCIILPAATPAT